MVMHVADIMYFTVSILIRSGKDVYSVYRYFPENNKFPD